MTISAVFLGTDAEHKSRTTWERLKSLIADEANVPHGFIQFDMTWSVVNLGPGGIKNVACRIEDEFRIRITAGELEREMNFGSLALYIDTLNPHPANVSRTGITPGDAR